MKSRTRGSQPRGNTLHPAPVTRQCGFGNVSQMGVFVVAGASAGRVVAADAASVAVAAGGVCWTSEVPS